MFSPYVIARGRIHQLSRDAHLVVGPAYTSFQYVLHPQLLADILHFYRFALVGEGGGPGDNEEVRESGERGGQIIGDAVAEIFLLAIPAHVGEGQHGNRGLVGQWERGRLRRRNGCRWSGWSQGEVLHEYDGRGNYREPGDGEDAAPHIFPGGSLCLPGWRRRLAGFREHPEYSHGLRDVLDRLLAEVLVAQRKLVPKLFADGARDADAAWFGETLQARGHI